MGPYLADYLEDTQYLDHKWDTNDANGASITRAVDGTISVYKGNSDAQSVAGITDTKDFDGLTGIHHLRIDLAADAFYEVGYDYSIVLSAATIDGQTVNAVLATFSIENRFQEVDVVKWLGTTVPTPSVAGRPIVSGGYDGGAVWINTNIANTNTTSHVDGTIDNPVSTIAAATTIAAALGIKSFQLLPGSSITLAQNYDNYKFYACHGTIALGGQSVNNAAFYDAVITGNDDGSNVLPTQYFSCVFGNSTLGQFVMTRCYLLATITLAEAGDYRLHWCASGVAGTSTPTLDFGAGLNASEINMRGYSGGIEFANMGAGTGSYLASLEGHGQLIIAASCSATSTIAIRGHFPVTDNAGGTVTLSDDARYDIDQIRDAVLDDATLIDGSAINALTGVANISSLSISGAGVVDANAVQLSGDGPAADNLESQYDTTGLTGDTFPATQAQVGAIAGISAAGFPTEAEADNTGGAIKGIAFVGVQTSGTYASTEAEDGTYHQIDDAGNAIDIVYQFDLRGDRQAIEGIFKGYLSGGNDEIVVQAYDYVGTDWETRATISGQAGSTNINITFTLLSKHTGISGSDRGKSLVRFVCSGQSNPTLYVDELLVVATSLGQSVGYARGAVWIDTAAANTNTVDFVDGVADNPVSTIAAALTIAASVGLVHFEVATGSSITLGATVDGKTFNGRNWTLALGGQSCSDSVFVGATVSGTCTGAAKPRFERCIINAVTLPPFIMLTCGLAGTITIGSAGDFFFVDCVSLVAGASTPILDFGGALNSSDVSFRDYSGGIEIQNMGAGAGTYNMSLEGDGALVINVNCSATSNISLRGNFNLTDNSGGAVTVTTDDDTTDINSILVDTNETQSKLPTNNIMGSSVTSDKDDEIDAIKAVTDLLPDAGALNDLATLVGRLTAARAGYLDELAAANLPADVDTLLARLTAARAGYLDELAAANLPSDVDGIKAVTDLLPNAGALTDIDTGVNNIEAKLPANFIMGSSDQTDKDDEIDAIKTVTDLLPDAGALNDLATLIGRLTAARAGYLDELAAANLPADVDTLLARLTAARAGYLDELAAANIPADVDQIIADIALLEDVSAAQVNAEMLDVLNVDTFGEPGQGAPPATTTLQLKLAYLYKAFRNKIETTAAEARIFNDAGAVVDQKATVSDNGVTFTRGEFVSGP